MKLSRVASISALAACVVAVPVQAQPSFKTPVSYEEADKRAEALVARMTPAEKLQIVAGHNTFYIKGFPHHGIPELYMSDATQGVNIRRNLSNQLEKSTAFPAPIGLAASWNTGLSYDYAKAVGEQCRAGGIAVLLGPGFNMYRHSQNGRNFEYFGEDPHLAARMVGRYVAGVLDTGTIPTLKHFVANNTDYHRRTSNSVVDERTLHEIYLPAFKAGIDAGAMAVMTSYNQLNGEWTGQSRAVVTDLLRNTLGFKWLVMSDWWSVWDTVKITTSGLDLEMPGDRYIRNEGQRFLDAGKIRQADIDRMARSILRTCIAMGLHDRPAKDPYYLARFPEHEKVALQAGREAIVLLKNEGGILPLRKDGKGKILVTGKFVEELARGGGAADVEGYDLVTLIEALKGAYGDRLEYVKQPTDAQIQAAPVVLLSTGTRDSEGWDRPFALPDDEEKAVRRVVGLNPRTVVIVNAGGGIQMTGWNDKAAAVLYAWYPGQYGNKALAEILTGETNPSAKLPITIEKRFEDSPGFGYLPPGAQLYTGWGPDNDMSQPVIDVHYKEGVFMGYRWYESKKIEPLYPFGHGLSYTTFNYEDLKLNRAEIGVESRISIEVTVTNTGSVEGTEVVQLYVSPVDPPLPRPLKELKGFAKLTVKPGESKVARIRLTAPDFSYYDVKTHSWRAAPGDYKILVGPSSASTPLSGTFTLK